MWIYSDFSLCVPIYPPFPNMCVRYTKCIIFFTLNFYTNMQKNSYYSCVKISECLASAERIPETKEETEKQRGACGRDWILLEKIHDKEVVQKLYWPPQESLAWSYCAKRRCHWPLKSFIFLRHVFNDYVQYYRLNEICCFSYVVNYCVK